MAEIIKQQDTRRVFIDTLIKLAEKDSKVVLIVADVGFNYIEEYQRKFPDRFYNLGITEQNAMIIAAGLALSGFKPYIYSMINFMVFRPYEMVRNAVCLHNANVKIIGVKGSEKYAFLGFSHNLISENEDIKALERLPNIRTFVANSPEKTRRAVLETYKIKGPAYIRI